MHTEWLFFVLAVVVFLLDSLKEKSQVSDVLKVLAV